MSTIRPCTIIRCVTAGSAFAYRTAADGYELDRLSPQPVACNHLLPSRTLAAGWQSDSRRHPKLQCFDASGWDDANRQPLELGTSRALANPEPANAAPPGVKR